MSIVRSLGNTTDVPVNIDLSKPVLLNNVIGCEKDIANLFECRFINTHIDFTNLDVCSMRECFRGAIFGYLDFTTLAADSVEDMTDMILGTNIPSTKLLGYDIKSIECLEGPLYFHRDFYGDRDELMSYFRDMGEVVDEDMVDMIDQTLLNLLENTQIKVKGQ